MASKVGEPRVPMTLQKSRLKAEEKILDFDFELVNVQFNETGRYALRLTVENPLLEGSGAGVQLRVNSEDPHYTNTATTDVIEQSNLNDIYAFEKRRFLFTLPKGFCKNDKNHDARLRIEALRLRGALLKSSVKAGESFFAIYPRTNQPRMNLFASKDEDLYRYSDIMALLRVSTDDLAMHCGRLAYTVSFHEHRPITKKEMPSSSRCSPLPPAKQDETHGPGTNFPAPFQSLGIPQQSYSVSTPEPSPRLSSAVETHSYGVRDFKVKEDPVEHGQPVQTSGTSNQHLANSTKESITVTLHGANNLPSTKKGHVPSPYVIIKTTSDDENKQPAQGVTHAAVQPTHSPSWEEKVTVEIEAQKAGEEDVSLIVADKDTKEILARYNIPVKYLRPFHHYHCALTLPRKKDPAGTKLYATLVRKRSIIPRYAGIDYTGLEVFLRGVNETLADPEGSVIAIARIVNNVKAYQEEMKSRASDVPPVPLTVANFPDPVIEEFDVPRLTNQGYPQVSIASGPPEKPVWNTSYLFQGRDGATAFSDDTALVIEYFKSKPEMEGKPKPLGFSVLPLTNRVYRRLLSERSKNGVQVRNLPIQNTALRTTSGEAPTVQLGLQLINSERPDTFLNPSTTNGLPLLDPDLVDKLGNIKEPWTRPSSKTTVNPASSEESIFVTPERKKSLTDLSVLHKDENGFPSHDAVAGILPDKQLYTRPVFQEVPDVETDTFRSAIQRMADDILSLRRHIASLETENNALRRNLAMHEDVGRVLLEDIDLDVMTRAEIVDRIMSLKQKLSAGAREMAKMKDRVQRLQNELIRKNDREKDLLLLQRAHQQQQVALRKYQAKIAKMKALEDAVRQQEKVIESMERMLEEKMMDRYKDTVQDPGRYPVPGDRWAKDLYTTLMTENTRLRDELSKSCYRSSPIILQQQALPEPVLSNSEKLSLLTKLEKAEARIHVLECQLEESARKWGREKQNYSTRLLEHERGFSHSPTAFILPEFTQEERERKGDEEAKNRKAHLDSPSQVKIKTLYTAQ
ncbi:coiled-coil domain-containing protein 33 [Eublepharis macularius]|uniref:Coiled-coil domain-containing protein 33 n=1 Tax=Eublepharis macularius TaxID=481883 RepID=A0AA97KLL8_EUBMA|nr:coiled-coil domain-containing protein 33 [Eublepharis macularius]